MSLKLHPLKVSKLVKLNKDAVAIDFAIPAEMKDIFKYTHGQFISIEANINGEKYRREYSLCSSPYYENNFTIASKKILNGIVSNYLYNDLKEGDTLMVFPPNGKFFTELDPANEKIYFLIGGGSGITPLTSIMKSVLHVEPKSKVILYYGSTDEEGIIFRDELIKLQSIHPERFKLFFTIINSSDTWSGLNGMINGADLLKLIKDNTGGKPKEAEYFICGPVEMMDKIKIDLVGQGIDQKKIHIEYFTAPVHAEEFIPVTDDQDETKERKVHILLDGEEHFVNVNPGDNILNSAIKADLDPPFSCKSGICTTCRAKLYSGKVRMDEREGLSDSEVEEGYILTCQSHPLTDNVKLEYM
ncbi:MAG: 2Fe-2S iron-sulfur cluster-binding protein [Ignavibacteria bacterium]